MTKEDLKKQEDRRSNLLLALKSIDDLYRDLLMPEQGAFGEAYLRILTEERLLHRLYSEEYK